MLLIYFAIDNSSSMKLFYDKKIIQKIICSISYILLKLNFTLNIITYNSQINNVLTLLKGEKSYSRISFFLESIEFDGKTDITSSIKNIYKQFKPKVLFIFSDFFDPKNKVIYKSLFKKLFLIHFFTSFEDIFKDYTDFEVLDYEENNSLILPFDASTYNELKNRQNQFINILNSKDLNCFYSQIDKAKIDNGLKELYWQILEKIYE